MKKTLTIICSLFCSAIYSQTVYWNAKPSNNHPNNDSLYLGDFSLEKTAKDVANLLNLASGTSTYIDQFYSGTLPTAGIILHIDTLWETSKRLQYCTITGNGTNKLIFTASTSGGVRFGIYSYLAELGFKFYAPGDLWQKIPNVSSPFQNINKTYETTREVHEWFNSGGNGYAPLVDSTGAILDQKQEIYMLRNNMINEYAVGGHVGESWVEDRKSFLLANPCWVAEYDSAHIPTPGAMPSIFNTAAMMDYADYAASQQTSYVGSRDVTNRSRISIEAADGTRWGNTATSCGVTSWPSGSEQQFTLANFATNHLKSKITFPFKTTCYAYAEHPDPPTFSLDTSIQVGIANGYQTNASPFGQLHRWKNKHIVNGKPAIFEYEYFNLASGNGQPPYASMKYMADQAKRINLWNTLGVFHESTNSIFASCLYLNAYQKSLMDGSDFKTNFNGTITDLFPGSKSAVMELYELWGNENAVLNGGLLFENAKRFPHYFSLISKIDSLASGTEEIQRVRMLKAYMHYMVLQTDMAISSDDSLTRDPKVQTLCNYLASVWLTGIVNSYQQINISLSAVGVKQSTIDYWSQVYVDSNNVFLGFNYKPGPFIANPPITDNQIDANFVADKNLFAPYCDYAYIEPHDIVNEACLAGLIPKDTIFTTIQGQNSSSITYYIDASGPGSVRFRYNKSAAFANHKAQIIFDSQDGLYSFSKSIDSTQSGIIDLIIPKSGEYLLGILYRDSLKMDVEIISNGNYVYKNTPIYPLEYETYPDSISSPRFIYVPRNIKQLYFTVYFHFNDTITASEYQFRKADGTKPPVKISAVDSSQYYVEVDSANAGKFWQLYVPSTLSPTFYIVNTQNVELYLQSGICTPASVENIKNEIDFEVFPNPTGGIFSVRTKAEGLVNLTIFNITGQRVFHQQFAKWTGIEQLDLSLLTGGVYLIRLENKGLYSNHKIIISK